MIFFVTFPMKFNKYYYFSILIKIYEIIIIKTIFFVNTYATVIIIHFEQIHVYKEEIISPILVVTCVLYICEAETMFQVFVCFFFISVLYCIFVVLHSKGQGTCTYVGYCAM